ncbi:hypothetical protein [Novipirellula artificiosorum]|nr:hypothetical protein [Novipirellula artificiosorum]
MLALSLVPLFTNFANAKKPIKDDPPADLPLVRYTIEEFTGSPAGAPAPLDINVLGMVIGFYWDGTHFLYWHDLDGDDHLFYDLNNLKDLNTLEDIVWLNGQPEGTRIVHPLGINVVGQIVADMYYTDDEPAIYTPVLIDTFLNPNPSAWTVSVVPLPDDADDEVSSYAIAINDNGKILGSYQRPNGTWSRFLSQWYWDSELDQGIFLTESLSTSIATRYLSNGSLNNDGRVAVADGSTLLIFDPDLEAQQIEIEGLQPFVSVDDLGRVGCQLTNVKLGGKGGKFADYIVRYGPPLEAIAKAPTVHLFTGSNQNFMNSSGDAAYWVEHEGGYLVREGSVWKLADLIDTDSDPTIVDAWREGKQWVKAISDRDSNTGFPLIVSVCSTEIGGVILIPHQIEE